MAGSERKLAAILAADLVGYSRHMAREEEGTLRRLKAILAELVRPKVVEHRGRIVKTTGDGILVEFGSVFDAFGCALDIQEGMRARHRGMSADARMEFRIGINIGDIIYDEDDIFGDGVNVAARLESLAEPGGICVSARAWEDLRRLDVPFTDLGEQQLKNIASPVRAFKVATEGDAPPPAPPRRPGGTSEAPARRSPAPAYLIGGGIGAAGLAAAWLALSATPAPEPPPPAPPRQLPGPAAKAALSKPARMAAPPARAERLRQSAPSAGPDGMIFPDSAARRLDPAELAGLSAGELRIARNEIYARRGRIFRDAKLRHHFEQFDWYRPVASEVALSPTEAANVALLQSAEAAR